MTMLKSFLLLLTLLTLAVNKPLAADMNSRGSAERMNARSQIGELDKPYVPVLHEPGAESLGSANANAAAVATIFGVAIIQKKKEIEEQRGRKFSDSEKRELIQQIADTLTGDPSLVATFATMHESQKAVHPLVKTITGTGEVGPAMAVVRSAVARSLSLAVGMGSATAIGTLYDQAIKKLPVEDREKGQNLVNVLTAAALKRTPEERRQELGSQAAVFGQIVKNMGHIAIVDPSERNLWVYDTWRNGIATGNFVSGTAMIALGATGGSAIGSAVPIVGTGVGGFVGGTLGAVALVGLVSEQQKAALTQRLIEARKTVLRNRIGSCGERLRDTYRLSESPRFNDQHAIKENDLVRPLNTCGKLRESWMTISMDELKNRYSQLKIAQQRLVNVKDQHRTDEIEKTQSQIDRANAQLTKLTSDIRAFYALESDRLKRWMGNVKNPLSQKLLAEETSRLEKVSTNVGATLAKLTQDQNAAEQVFAASNTGFEEGDWLTGDVPLPLDTTTPIGTDTDH